MNCANILLETKQYRKKQNIFRIYHDMISEHILNCKIKYRKLGK